MLQFPPLRDVIAQYGLIARRSLAQHFIHDGNLAAAIVRQAGSLAGRHIVEIGAGPGGLTRALLQSDAATVMAIEVDPRCVAALGDLARIEPSRLKVVAVDALNVDVIQMVPPPRQIIANLPYNIGSVLLVKWLRSACDIERMTLMFQEEVAERICATPGTPAYGRLSVLSQWTCETRIALRVPPQSFVPPPKVSSAVVSFTPRYHQPSAIAFGAMERVTAAAFGQRRKMLRSALGSLGGGTLLSQAGIDQQRRAETLPVSSFDILARLVAGTE